MNDFFRCVMLVLYYYDIVFDIVKDFKNIFMIDNL